MRESPADGPPAAPVGDAARSDLSQGAAALTLGQGALGELMPMHLRLDDGGAIRASGPTLAKLLPRNGAGAMSFFELFDLKRPRGISTVRDLLEHCGKRLTLSLRQAPHTGFRGLAVPLAQDGGALLNLSFGISVADAVRDHALTDSDFAPTDLTVEMLYLAEAKTAVMDELHDLNRRLQLAKTAAEAQALSDTLTGLANRRAMDRVLEGLVATGAEFGLMHLDLDYFKQVNDNFGHAAGDAVLVAIAHVLRDETRIGDTVARVGGDEFVLILPGLARQEQLTLVAQRIIDRLAQPIEHEGNSCRVAASIGMTVSTSYPRPEPDRMLSDADRALYDSKNRGRSRATMFLPAET